MAPYSRRLSDGSSVVHVTVNADDAADEAKGPLAKAGGSPSFVLSAAERGPLPVLVSPSWLKASTE